MYFYQDFRVSEGGDSQVGSSRQKKSLFARQYDKRYQFVPRIKKDVVDKPVQQHATRWVKLGTNKLTNHSDLAIAEIYRLFRLYFIF